MNIKRNCVRHRASGTVILRMIGKKHIWKDAAAVLFFLLLAVVYAFPFIKYAPLWGRGDWDQMFFFSGVPQVTAGAFRQFPFWNPYYLGGASLIGNPQTRFISPSFVFTSLFGVAAGLRLQVVFDLFLGMTGMYVLCRHQRLSGLSALLPPVIFLMSSPFALHAAEGHMFFVTVVYLPWFVLFFLRALDDGAGARRFSVFASLAFSLMFYEGGYFIFVFSGLYLFVFALLRAAGGRSWRPLKTAVFIYIVSFLLCAPKLLPALELLGQAPRPTPLYSFVPGHMLYPIFLHPSQSIQNPYLPLPVIGWWEFGSYIGPIPFVLFLSSLLLWKKHWPLIVTGILFFLIGLGNIPGLSLWALLHKLPVFSSLRIPSRAFIFFIFSFALTAGHVTRCLQDRLSVRRWLRRALLAVLCLAAALDLYAVNAPVFYEAFRPVVVEESFDRGAPFRQVYIPWKIQKRLGGWSLMFPAVLDNKGVVNGYDPLPIEAHVLPVGHPDYKGEYYLAGNQGRIEETSWTPNRLVYRCELEGPDILVVNQNFDPNWRSDTGRIVRHQGLLAVALPAGRYHVTLTYRPLSFFLGCAVLLIGAAVCILFWHKGTRQRVKNGSSLKTCGR